MVIENRHENILKLPLGYRFYRIEYAVDRHGIGINLTVQRLLVSVQHIIIGVKFRIER